MIGSATKQNPISAVKRNRLNTLIAVNPNQLFSGKTSPERNAQSKDEGVIK
jgi:hypothetical protein